MQPFKFLMPLDVIGHNRMMGVRILDACQVLTTKKQADQYGQLAIK